MAKPIVSKDDPRIKKAHKVRKHISYIVDLEKQKDIIIADLESISSICGDQTIYQLLRNHELYTDISLRQFFQLLHIDKLIDLQLELAKIRAEWMEVENSLSREAEKSSSLDNDGEEE